MNIKPMPKCVIGKLRKQPKASSIIIDPFESERKETLLLDVLFVGEKVDPDIKVGSVLLLNPERYSAEISFRDTETEEVTFYTVVDCDPELSYAMAVYNA